MTRSIALPKVRASAALVLGAAALLFATSGEVGRSATTPTACYAPLAFPGASSSRAALAQWMGAAARAAGLPPELPVMAALVDSGLRNRPSRGTADSVGFFQMRVSVWNVGEYRGFPTKPQLQVKWFIDHAIAAKVQRLARGAGASTADPSSWGEWIADVERPAGQLRGRYQLRLEEARNLLKAPPTP